MSVAVAAILGWKRAAQRTAPMALSTVNEDRGAMPPAFGAVEAVGKGVAPRGTWTGRSRPMREVMAYVEQNGVEPQRQAKHLTSGDECGSIYVSCIYMTILNPESGG